MRKPIQLPGGVCLTGEEYRELMAKLAEKDKRIEDLLADYAGCFTKYKASEAFLAQRDREIIELKAENQAMEYLLNEGENIGVE